MATLLEQTRLSHEETERLERLIVAELSREARSHRERLAQAQRVAVMVGRITDRAKKLVRATQPCFSLRACLNVAIRVALSRSPADARAALRLALPARHLRRPGRRS